MYLCILTLFLIWFFKHPDLRYGGFILVGLIFFIPLSLHLSNYSISRFRKNIITTVIFLVLLSYTGRNIYRINAEVNRTDNFKYVSFPYFHIEEIKYKEKILGENNIKFYLSSNPWCWASPSPCSTDDKITAKNLKGYNFFIK